MSLRLPRFAVALFASTACVAGAQAQSSYPCANDLPDPYRLVTNWATTPRGWARSARSRSMTGTISGASTAARKPGCKSVFEIGPDGKTIRNFGTDLFVEPHQVAVDHDGNVWVADASAKGAKGLQVTKLSPDGRVLLKLGKPGQGGQRGVG